MVVAVAGSQAAVHNNRPQPTKGKTTNLAPQPPQFLRQKSTLQRALAPDALPHQERVRQLYVSDRVQKIIAVIIMLNFFGNMIEKEIDPPMGEEYKSYWQVIEDAFNYVFLAELIFNLYGHWFFPFWKSSWNIFDFLVVTVGVMSLLRLISGPLRLLRMLRAFRVFRLFKRVKSLNKIIVSLGRAVPGVVNAFVIMVIIMAIYAILAVEFFHGFGANATLSNTYTLTYTDWDRTEHEVTIDALTARGIPYGIEYYGSFSRAFFTMWQILTGESWSEVIVRPILFGWHGAGVMSAVLSGLFFVSFFIICAIVLINVVVAVLLEKMVEPPEEDEADEGEGVLERQQEGGGHGGSMLDLALSTACKPMEAAPEASADPSYAVMKNRVMPFRTHEEDGGAPPQRTSADEAADEAAATRTADEGRHRLDRLEAKVDRLLALEQKLDLVLEQLAGGAAGRS